ncbi:MAG: glycosyltransferase [Acidimicrobiales bacterium]|nr:glycosyltransferase [Acidimicrobiales bacterium]
MTGPTAALLVLGRARGLGEAARVRSWEAILGAAGVIPVVVPLLTDHRTRLPHLPLSQLRDVSAGRTTPETLAWSLPSLRRRLDRLQPDLVVSVTNRAFHPSIGASARCVVLDAVDPLAVSYAQRARSVRNPARKAVFGLLGWAHARFEQHPQPQVVRTLAGWSDAAAAGVQWLPNVVQAEPEHAVAADHDLVFFGNLGYAPNVEAVERLDRAWPAIARVRPGTTLLLAGSHAAAAVRHAAQRHGWTLLGPYDDVADVCGRARIAIAPLTSAVGIQNKVLEAAAHGLAQIVSPAAAGGFAPGFPFHVAPDDASLIREIVDLLDDEAARVDLAQRARAAVRQTYTPEAWAPLITMLLGDGPGPLGAA